MSDNCDNYNYYDDTGSNSTQGSGSFDNWANPSEPRRIEGFFEDDVRAFVGNNADKYLERFHCITRGQKPYNWCSALFSASWMIYRRMWKPALALTVIVSLLNSVFNIFGMPLSGLYLIALYVFYFVYLGRQGNVLYWEYVKQELTKAGLANLSQPNYEARENLGKAGGTSVLFVILLIIFSSALSNILGWIF